MLEAIGIVLLGVLPALLSLLLMRKAEAQARERLQTAMRTAANRSWHRCQPQMATDHRYVEGIGYLLGDITCQFNARSAYLRCAVNPQGPCQNCSFYQSIEFKDAAKSVEQSL